MIVYVCETMSSTFASDISSVRCLPGQPAQFGAARAAGIYGFSWGARAGAPDPAAPHELHDPRKPSVS